MLHKVLLPTCIPHIAYLYTTTNNALEGQKQQLEEAVRLRVLGSFSV